MKTIGLLGGMSWESSAHYYTLLNQEVRKRLGGLHSAKIIMASVDFAEIAEWQRTQQWPLAGEKLAHLALQLQNAGAELLLIGTNTMHKVADIVARDLRIPLLHIADPTGQALRAQDITKVALLGTRFTMAEEFYSARLQTNFDLEVCVPNAIDQDEIHRIIFEELCQGQLLTGSRETLQQIIDQLAQQGAQAVILGCTELGLLIKPSHSQLPLFDTTELHAKAAIVHALT